MSHCVEFGENIFNYTFKNRTHYKLVGSFSFSSIMTCELESWRLQANKYPQVIALFIAKVTCRSLRPLLRTAVATQESNLVPRKWSHSISWHLFLNSMKTPARRMLCVFFSSNISAVPQLFETCCGFDFFQLPPVMKITLIACLWNIQSETEYSVTITNRWRLIFYIPCYSISSFLWIFVVVFSLKPEYPLKSCDPCSSFIYKVTSWSEKRLVFLSNSP